MLALIRLMRWYHSTNSDCEIEGRCSSESPCAGRDCEAVNICKYD